MPPLLLLVLVAVIVVVATVAGVFLRRRSRRAAEARIAAASNPVPMLSEDDIAWRIGVLGTERPGLLSAYFEDAETQAEAAAADEVGTPLPALLQGPPSSPSQLMPPAPSPAVPTAAVAAAVKAKPKASRREPNPPASRRYRLWRDSAMVLLGAVLLVLFVSTVVPSFGAGPRPTKDALESSAAIAVVITEAPTEPPSDRPGVPRPRRARPIRRPPRRPRRRRVHGADRDPGADRDAQAHAAGDPQAAAGALDAPSDAAPDAPADAAPDAQAHAEAHAQADPEADAHPGAEREVHEQPLVHPGQRCRPLHQHLDRDHQEVRLDVRGRRDVDELVADRDVRYRPLVRRPPRGHGPGWQ